MGPARPFGDGEGDRRRPGASTGCAVSMGNPHLACLTDVDVDTLDLTGQPEFDADLFPDGVNVELVDGPPTPAGDAHPAARARARRGGDPLLRHRRLRRGLRRARRRRAGRPAPSSSTSPAAGCRCGSTRGRRCSPAPRCWWPPASSAGSGSPAEPGHGSVGLVGPGLRLVGRRLGLVARADVALAAGRALAGVLGCRRTGRCAAGPARPGRGRGRRARSSPLPRLVDPPSLGMAAPTRRPAVTTGSGVVASSSSGRSRMLISGLSTHRGAPPAAAPATLIHSAGQRRRASCPARRRAGRRAACVPQTMNRTEAFIRPSSAGGHSRCRKLTWVML